MQIFNRSSTTRTARSSAGTAPSIQFLLAHVVVGRRNGTGAVIAFTSANPGAGVSHVTRILGAQLASQTCEPTAIVEAERLNRLQAHELINLRAKCARTNINHLWVLRKSVNGNGNGHQPSAETETYSTDGAGLDRVHALRATFHHTLLDCPSINDSPAALLIVPQVDGVVLVVEADRTRRDQILRARQTIEMSGGKLSAMVLNKRQHLVPEWLYRVL
ncbi:MAG TPA: hypothetical protein VFZ40_02605 [Pyrinomonadaceae bacterium]